VAKTYRPYIPEQDLLLPPSLREWLPEDHLTISKISTTTGHQSLIASHCPFQRYLLAGAHHEGWVDGSCSGERGGHRSARW
jgi:hypothetical protein